MRTVALLVLLSTEALADDLRPEWNVLYGHEEFRKAETILHDHLAKARASADQDRENSSGMSEHLRNCRSIKPKRPPACKLFSASFHRERH